MSDLIGAKNIGRRTFLEMTSGLLLSTLSPNPLLATAWAVINSMRQSSDAKKIRIVLDVDQPIQFRIDQDSTKKKIEITLLNCRDLSTGTAIKDPDISLLTMKREDTGTVMTIDCVRPLKPNVFELPADKANNRSERLVIDLLRTNETPAIETPTHSPTPTPAADSFNATPQSDHQLDAVIETDKNKLAAEARKEEEERLKAASTKKNGLQFGVNKVLIDPGHGGFDSGAVGKSGLQEKEVALLIATYLRDLFKAETSIKPYLSRSDDYFVPLGERTTIANQYRADLFISVHINSAVDNKSEGLETFYCSETASDAEAARLADYENAVGKDEDLFKETPNFISFERILNEFERRIYWAESSRFADVVQKNMLSFLKRKNRQVRYANFFVLRRAKMPSLLCELGFISNPEEEKLLKTVEYQKNAAQAIFTGIMSYVRQ